MRKTLKRIIAILIILNISLICALSTYAEDDVAAESIQEPSTVEVKVYSKDSSCGTVINGGTITVDENAYVTSMGNRIIIGGVNKDIFASPKDGYIFDGWENVPEDNRVKEGNVILAKFSPIGLETASYVSAALSDESKKLGRIVPTQRIKVLTNAEVQVFGSTVLIAKEGFSAIPEEGAVFSHWEGLPEDGTIHGDTQITAVFKVPEQSVTVSLNEPAEGGDFISTTGSTEIVMPVGAEITVKDSQIALNGTEYCKAIPYSGYVFAGWTGLPTDGIVREDLTVTASFNLKPVPKDTTPTEYSMTEGDEFNVGLKYGAMGDPVSDGLWILDNDGTWYYNWHIPMANAWGCIVNPYAKVTQPQYGWFYFDKMGRMLTGWQLYNGKWYFLEPISNGCKGQLYANESTSDGQSGLASKTRTGASK